MADIGLYSAIGLNSAYLYQILLFTGRKNYFSAKWDSAAWSFGLK
jgi:hypothetical protein